MKKIIIICACLALAAGVHAQNSIEAILQQIETNNKEIQAYAHTTEAQKLENRASNNLADPTLSYAHLWDSQDKNITVGELIITQSFDFPSLYVSRARMNQLKANALNAQTNAQRQSILLQAQEACLDIIYLNRKQQLLDERLKNAEELAACYRLRMKTGDANTLEINKINLELLNVRTEARMNRTALDSKLKELTALNGNLSLVPGRPMPDGSAAATVQNLGLTDYPSVPLPADFGPGKPSSTKTSIRQPSGLAAQPRTGLSPQHREPPSSERLSGGLLVPHLPEPRQGESRPFTGYQRRLPERERPPQRQHRPVAALRRGLQSSSLHAGVCRDLRPSAGSEVASPGYRRRTDQHDRVLCRSFRHLPEPS